MIDSVLLDTSFLITLCDPNRAHHPAAKAYYRALIERDVPMHLSTVVVSEFEVRQPIRDLELRNFIVLPFNIDHAITCGRLLADTERDGGDDRVRVKDDFKLIAQCICTDITHVLTEDGSSLVKYLVRARQSSRCTTQALTLSAGFDPSVFEGGQGSLLT